MATWIMWQHCVTNCTCLDRLLTRWPASGTMQRLMTTSLSGSTCSSLLSKQLSLHSWATSSKMTRRPWLSSIAMMWYGPCCIAMVLYKPCYIAVMWVWTMLYSYDVVWTMLYSYDVVWTMLYSYDMVWTMLHSYDVVWTVLSIAMMWYGQCYL